MNDIKESSTEQTIQVGSGETKIPNQNKSKTIISAIIIAVLVIAGVFTFVIYQKKAQEKRDHEAIVAFENNRFNETQNAINLLLMRNDQKAIISKADEYIATGTVKKNLVKMKLTKARAYESLKDYPTALSIYKDAEKDANASGDTMNYSLHHGLGLLYLKNGEKDKAIEQYEIALKGLKRNEGPNRMEISQITEEIRLLKARSAQ